MDDDNTVCPPSPDPDPNNSPRSVHSGPTPAHTDPDHVMITNLPNNRDDRNPDSYAAATRLPPSHRAILSTPRSSPARHAPNRDKQQPRPRATAQRTSFFTTLDWSTANPDDISWLIAVFHPLGRSSTTYRSLHDAASSINGRLLTTRNGFTDYIAINPNNKNDHIKSLILHGWCAFDAFPRLQWTTLSPTIRKQCAITTQHLPSTHVRDLVHKLLRSDHAAAIAAFDTRHRRDQSNTSALTISCVSLAAAEATLSWITNTAKTAAHYVQPTANYFNRLITKAPITTTFIHELGAPSHVYVKNDPGYPSPRHCVVVCLPSDWPAVHDLLNDHGLIAGIIDTPPDFTPSTRSRQQVTPDRRNPEPDLSDDNFPPLPSSSTPQPRPQPRATRPTISSAPIEEFYDHLDRLETHLANAFAAISTITDTLKTLPTTITNTLITATVDAILKNPLFTNIQSSINTFRADLDALAINSPPPLTKRTADNSCFKRVRHASSSDHDSQ